MPRHPDITPETAKQSDHAITRALWDGIASFQPSHRRPNGQAMCDTEVAIRARRQMAARGLVLVIESGRRAGAPLEGPNGALQIFERAKFATRLAYNAVPRVDEFDLRNLRETLAEGAMNVIQVRRFDQMNPGECEDAASRAETQAEELQALALCYRARAHELVVGTVNSRRMLGVGA